MKKHILKFSLALAVLVAAGYTVYSSQTSLKMTGIALNNVEALANEEIGGSGYCTMHLPCYDEYGNPTGEYSATSYSGPNCSGPYHVHTCTSCNG